MIAAGPDATGSERLTTTPHEEASRTVEAGTPRTVEADTPRSAEAEDPLSQPEVERRLSDWQVRDWIRSVHYRAKTESTNAWASLHATADTVSSPTDQAELFITSDQTTGRGRLGRSWLSAAGANLTFSLLLMPAASPEALATVTLLAGLSVVEGLSDWLASPNLDRMPAASVLRDVLAIKWPNDVILTDRRQKLGGILVESRIRDGAVRALIVGIGINVNQDDFSPELADSATSLAQRLGRPIPRIAVLGAILPSLRKRLARIGDPAAFLPAYRRRCATIGQHVDVYPQGGEAWPGTALDVDPAGELIVRDRFGRVRAVRSGEVSIRFRDFGEKG